MKIIKYDENEFTVDGAIENGEPIMAVISHDGKEAILSHLDIGVEHHILLDKAGKNSADLDGYFRIIFDKTGADWTFVCPTSYKNIFDKTRRISEFYKDGFAVISDFLSRMGYLVSINIPQRYRRHFRMLMGN